MQTNYCGENSGEKMCPLIVSSVSLPIEMLYFFRHIRGDISIYNFILYFQKIIRQPFINTATLQKFPLKHNETNQVGPTNLRTLLLMNRL